MLTHCLMSTQLASDLWMHAYSITDTKNKLINIRNLLMDQAEKAMEGHRWIPIILETNLDADGAKKIRAHIRKLSPEAREGLKKARNSHCTIWAVHGNNPAVDWIVELH